MSQFLAIDWGTSNRRVFLLDDGRVLRTERDATGTRAMAGRDWAAELADVRARFGDLPVLIAGMAGSTIGWREAPYVPEPADAAALARGALRIDARTAIVPGVKTLRRPDVMRGEETQLVGAVAAGLAPRGAVLLQPGTHNKWVRMAGDAVGPFRTMLTGEMFAMLRSHSILGAMMQAEAAANDAFANGVRAAADADLIETLFGLRAGVLLGRIAEADAPSYASGLVIGADVAAGCRWAPDHDIFVLAGEPHASLYARALALHGRTAHPIDSHAAFVAGACRIQALL